MNEREKCVAEVVDLIKKAIDEDWIVDFEIDEETTFNDDLELESIEFIQIAEKIQTHYSSNITMTDWLATMDFEKVVSLNVGDLVSFIQENTAKA